MLKVPVFYYHSIGNVGPETLAAERFRQHLCLLKDAGYTTLTASELIHLDKHDCSQYVALTFDDGLLDNYEIAVPILEQFGFKATFFVIPGFDNLTRWVNPKTRQWSDVSKQGFTIPFPSMQQHHRRELSDMGMEIGSHSMTHPKLNKIPVSRLQNEILESRHRLEDQLGKPVTSFCYPKGRYNTEVLHHIKSAGYECAFTTMPSYYEATTPRYECGRFLIESPALFERVLRWSSAKHLGVQSLCQVINPVLKLKNYYT
ncbi:MAG TPA: polysaccharide deacetylase family protein [Crenotrichaceae bacterium]|nr:polysaccharide deacetylase family protein [Crenotrichaceae bacterium]